MDTGDAVMTFASTFHALRGEKRLRQAQLECKLGPTPRELSSTCALALFFSASQIQRVANLMKTHKLAYEGLYACRATPAGLEVTLWNGLAAAW